MHNNTTLSFSVLAPEFFLTPNLTVVANQSGSLVLTCVAFGVPAPSVRWERFGGEIPESANISIVSWISDDVEFISSTLELCDLQISDIGLYSCIANNSVGENQYNFTITLSQCKSPDLVCRNMLIPCILYPPFIFFCSTSHYCKFFSWGWSCSHCEPGFQSYFHL